MLPAHDTVILPWRFDRTLHELPQITIRHPVANLLHGVNVRISPWCPPNIIAFERRGEIIGIIRLDAEGGYET